MVLGAIRTTGGRRRAAVCRRFLSQHRLHAQQERSLGPRIAYLVRHAAQFGTITGPVTTDMVKVRQRKRDMVDREIARYLPAFKEHMHAALDINLPNYASAIVTANEVIETIASL